MNLEAYIDRFSRGWRAPAFAALIAFLAGLPGVFAMPPLDRDESRFAQATAQMLESGDFVVIRFQDQPRFKKPVGIHWLQAGSVAAFSSPEDREIWAYRLPSLLGAMLAAAACAWGAAAFFETAQGCWLAGCSAPPSCSPPKLSSPRPTRCWPGPRPWPWRRWGGSMRLRGTDRRRDA